MIGCTIALELVSRTYDNGRTVALENATLQVHAGEMVAIVGRSGSGKSTLLRVIGLLEPPSSGRYWLNDEDILRQDDSRLSALRADLIGFVFQDSLLIPYLNALENVILGFSAAANPQARLSAATATLARLELAHRSSAFPATLSGGERQRVATARALAPPKPILLCDEPTGNLDSATRNVVFDALRSGAREGRTTILVTHDDDLAAKCDRTVRIVDGAVMDETRN